MNKRIKKKIAKCIINKIGTEQPLTNFERKYLIKFFWQPLKKYVNKFVEELKAEVELEIQFIKEKINELNDGEEAAVEQAEYIDAVNLAEGPDMDFHPVTESTTEEMLQNAIDAMNNFGKQMNPETSAPVEEPNKWNKLKGKVKGWFGK